MSKGHINFLLFHRIRIALEGFYERKRSQSAHQNKQAISIDLLTKIIYILNRLKKQCMHFLWVARMRRKRARAGHIPFIIQVLG